MTAACQNSAMPVLHWLSPGEAFPSTQLAWPASSEAPGLLAAGGSLDTESLVSAYTQGIFPWFSDGQPILWWTTSPRMVLLPRNFKLSHSLRKLLRQLLKQDRLHLRINSDFATVIHHCANNPRKGQNGTWITADMQQAYIDLHEAGYAHSVETWLDGKLVGGLYLVSIGHMVYGESMFSLVSNASKMALAGLIAHCRANNLPLIDCQQQTSHMTSMGGAPVSRELFEASLVQLTGQPAANWTFDPGCWAPLLEDLT